jgi:tetratricopeptide (TPR) repeat protein
VVSAVTEPRTATSAALALAEEALATVPASPERAEQLAREAHRQAQAEHDHEAAIVAQRALGLVGIETGRVKDATVVLRRALRAAERQALPVRAAEARMTLALALLYCGEAERALAELDMARGALHGVAAARLEMQRALVLQKLDRPDDALVGYRRALRTFRRDGDRLWEARLLSNRGVLRAERGEFATARRDLERAERLFSEQARTLAVAQVRQNLGWMEARIGNVPAAFAHLDGAERAFNDAGAITGLLRLDRGALLAGVGLLSDARRELALAIGELAGGGMEMDVAEAWVSSAELALLDGDPEAAIDGARRAERAFAAHGRTRWRTLARLALLRAQAARGGAQAHLCREASELAEELSAAGWMAAAVDARLVAARAALDDGQPEVARTQLQRASPTTRTAPLAVRAAAWHAEALLRLHEGDRHGAGTAIAAGLRAVEAHRATLGATELRVHASRHGVALASLGIELALRSRSARRVLVAAERARAGALRFPPLRPPRESRVAALLAELRGVIGAIDETILADRNPRSLVAQQASLERRIRAHARHTAAGGVAGTLELDDLTAVLGRRVLVELVEHGGEIHAVQLVDGIARLRHVGAAADVAADQRFLSFALRRLARGIGTQPVRRSLAETAEQAAARLDEYLLGGSARDLARDLVVIPTGSLHGLPWGALPSCRERAVSIAPSAGLWLRAARRPALRETDSCTLVAGPGLEHADAEVANLAGVYPRATVLTGADATVQRTLDALERAPQAHIAAHGSFRADNPLFSSLRLHDGALTVFDLESLGTPPRRMILSACDAARSTVEPGDELRGLVAALLALGTATVIASVLPVPDTEARAVASRLHLELQRGVAPATALATATVGSPNGAGFACYGAG